MLRRRAQVVTLDQVARDLGIDPTNVGRWVDAHLDRCVQFIVSCGCKVVSTDLICLPEDRLKSLEFYADIGWKAEREKPPMRVLDWELDE
jgi:hypothetical protein